MKEQIINKTELIDLLSGLSGECQVFAPVTKDGSLFIKEIQSGDDITLGAVNTKNSIKSLFFPQRESMLTYDLSKPGEMKEPDFSHKTRVVFGVRPCDVKSLLVFDHVFNGDKYKDPYYLNKRENSIIISIGCNEPSGTCFCTATDGGPFSTDQSDIQMCDLGDTYLALPVTEKGETFIKDNVVFKDADDTQIKQRQDIAEKAEALVNADIDLEKVKKWLDENFDNDFWETLYKKCVSCGTCTYLCPTCHCFDIQDESMKGTGERLRIWDSCMYPLFTLHASGGNPRKTGKERWRQRVMHKFKYFVDNNNMVSCTGCGRCVQYCPVNLDIREVLKQIQES